LPLTPNGKVDRKALPKPDPARPELEKRYATPRDAIELELTRIWENVLGVRPIGIEDKFFELGGHSLLAVRVIAQIEKSFSRKLKLATIFQAQTIEQLAAILRKDIQEDSAISGTSLVEIQPKGSRPPLFLVHGAGGGMFWGYVNLSRHLGQDQPVYGLRSRALDGREEFQTIEQMAAQYIDDLRAIQPRGPYHIGGYCFGGNVAYEMARQLRQHGEDISALALFNCAPANSRYSHLGWTPRWFLRFGINLGYWAKYFLNWTPPQRREFFRWKREMFKRRADRFLGHSKKSKATVDAGELVDLSSYSEEQRKLWESHIRALVNYHPQPFPGRVYLFRSPGHPLLCSFDHDYGWGDLAKGGVEIAVVPGVHERILEEPCVKALAEQLATVLERQPGTRKTPEPTANANLQDRSYAAHFAAQASRTPTATAICFNGAELDFSELNARANRLAHRLQALGAGPDTFVAICLERSLEMPVAMLATLKAGAAYVPLDSAYPIERLNFMLADCRPGVLVTRSSLATKLNTGNATVICLDHPEEQVKLAESPTDNPACESGPDHLAYVLYTSGSTGEPKGVQITHRALLNHNFAIADTFQLTDSDRVLQFNPFSFDLSVEEIFPSWLRGATVVMRTDEVLSSVTRFFDWIAREKLTVINLPTAYWHEIVEHLSTIKLPETLRLIVIGGEAASPEAWRRWKKVACSKVVLINAYGPTEATVTATVHVARPEDDSLPIGQPLANTQVIIVDEHLQRVGPGAEGELLIGGAGLASGYLNRPELTAEKFIANPFPEISSDRLYRTGDRARFRSDGAVEFLGRADEQVKIRGYRIELGEIENALRSHASVKEAVVCAREDVAGLRRIVAYVVRRDRATSVGELLEFLKSKLPAYMIPAAFVHLDAFPLTPAGKIDRHQLPPPGNERPDLEKKFVAPRTP
ncbi:MAG TPA: amino acid adenylation domain-containing protein, partial [Candidatus Paceibacterota bacterium]|nr:amino acid adenylation domain-containing protein [Candidatus Paceibacterota bacterium]